MTQTLWDTEVPKLPENIQEPHVGLDSMVECGRRVHFSSPQIGRYFISYKIAHVVRLI